MANPGVALRGGAQRLLPTGTGSATSGPPTQGSSSRTRYETMQPTAKRVPGIGQVGSVEAPRRAGLPTDRRHPQRSAPVPRSSQAARRESPGCVV